MTAVPRRRTGPLLFVPAAWQRAAVLRWLKRVHAWSGLWGALLFFALGSSGFLLNHRAVLKIDAGAPREVSSADVAVASGLIRDAPGLDRWMAATFGVRGEGRPPAPEPGGAVRVLGRPVAQAARLTRVYTLTNGRLTASTIVGAPAVTVTREAIGVLAILKNLHKGVGMGVGWILLIDTVAGALMMMSVTGVLLWSRLHGPRLAAAALGGASALWAGIAIGSSLAI